MRHYALLTPLAGLALAAAAAGLQSCDTKMYEKCPPDRIIGDWGVMDNSHTFGEYDSLYYVVNPIANVSDTVYYNGNYTDSYYHSDPVRVMMRYTTGDSILFNLDRLYATETNPRNIIMTVEQADDSLHVACVLHLRRGENDGNLYRTGPDTLFRRMLLDGKELRFRATNGNSSSEPEGSQNYEFTIWPAGFDKALQMADSLNKARCAGKTPDGKTPDGKTKDRYNHKIKE